MASGAVIAPNAYRRLTRRRATFTLLAAWVVLVVSLLVALSFGATMISPSQLFDVLTGTADIAIRTIVLDLRLPRLVLALSVGAALASSGVIFQALLRNPLAEPYIMGISNGCAVGAILGYLVGLGPAGSTVLAMVGGGIVVTIVLRLAREAYGISSESMLLGGTMVAAVGAAMIFLSLHFLGPDLRQAIKWLLGDLSSATAAIGYSSIALPIVLSLAAPFAGDMLNALSLGDDEAAALGFDITRVKRWSYLAASCIVGAAVSFCGAIGFVGLVVPHILRRIVGPDHRLLLPLSIAGGGLFLVICDTISRSALPLVERSASELPVGAITAMIGAPIFIYVLRRRGA